MSPFGFFFLILAATLSIVTGALLAYDAIETDLKRQGYHFYYSVKHRIWVLEQNHHQTTNSFLANK